MRSSQYLHGLAFAVCISPFFPLVSFSQNVGIGITSPVYKLDVRNGSINTDSVYRIGGITVLSVKGNGNTFTGNNAGTVNTGVFNTGVGERSLASNGSGHSNTAIGRTSLGMNTVGSENVAIGRLALGDNTSGSFNTANGTHALISNTTGSYNTASGYHALFDNYTGNYNTATGVQALVSNHEGSYNTATGVEALKNNTWGEFNAAHGYLAMFSNVSGSHNAALGYRALFSLEAGLYNVAVGFEALGNSIGIGNVGIGSGADVLPNTVNYGLAVGYNTTVTASNTARFGNSSTISYGGWAGWTNVSDGRFKKDIQENVPGLDFINKLRPVTYTLNAALLDKFYHKNDKNKMPANKEANTIFETALQEKSKIIYTGFIAQEVEAAAKQLGFDFSGVDAAKNENDTYGLRYAEFVVPLVKAVQEQQTMIKALQKQNELLQQRIEQIENKK